MPVDKRKKFHDKDKYYRLAKEQGLRSRAAFKLVQINRKYGFLEKSSSILDLCAAPGGWSQIAARTCAKSTTIVAVDILPIRHLPGVTTIVGDITTDVCRNKIQQALSKTKNGMVDVVLHDGAPNVGADYGKDAFVQNELALAACRAAVQHLKPNTGTFVTKVYRSRDYAALHWALSQIFQTVSTFKPSASRPQSAEIFLIGQKYNGASVDPRLLDPKHVFGSTSEIEVTNQTPTVNIFHKAFDKHTRKRNGYDMEFLDATMRHIEPVGKFVSISQTQAIQMLSVSTGIAFRCGECTDVKQDGPPPSCTCQFLLHHPLTTSEIKESCSDLQLLSKADFKHLLLWRTKMQEALEHKDKGSDDDEASDADSRVVDEKETEQDSEQEEEEIQKEISEMRQRRMRERKKIKKKERAAAAKRRRHAALGMDLNAIDVGDNDKVFSLSSIPTEKQLNQLSEVNLDRETDDQIFGAESDDDVLVGHSSGEDDDDSESDDERRQRRRERDLDEAYKQYLETTKNGLAKSGTKMAKRSKKLQRLKVLEEVKEDQDLAMVEDVSYNVNTYAKMLNGEADSDDDSNGNSESDSDDGFNAEPMTPVEFEKKKESSKGANGRNRLIYELPDDPASVKTARWFSNPLFSAIGKAAAEQSTVGMSAKGDDQSSATEHRAVKKSESSADRKGSSGLSADDIIASLPKTDKQIRHEKRLKQMAKDERKKAKRAAKLGEADHEFQLVAADNVEKEEVDRSLENVSETQKKRILEARELIKAGMGTATTDDSNDVMEVVARDHALPVVDDRKYDSEHEDYDSDDYARTLAIGTMILRKSKEKAFVDASYNRYAWNDPAGLPEWFVDDENKHHRPQLPIPPALLAKMKEKMMALSTKPIAKVAEARARKSKRAKMKLDAAKKKAEALANSSEMSESMKLKAISKALRVQDAKKPGKSYIVAKKGRNNKGVKGAKLVDRRLKSDKRAADRVEKKRKKGKQGGLVGSKKRRRHN